MRASSSCARSWRCPTSSSRHLAEVADDARLRSLVSETPLADREHQDAQRHADAMHRHRADVIEQIAHLEQTQDELLDRLVAETRA